MCVRDRSKGDRDAILALSGPLVVVHNTGFGILFHSGSIIDAMTGPQWVHGSIGIGVEEQQSIGTLKEVVRCRCRSEEWSRSNQILKVVVRRTTMFTTRRIEGLVVARIHSHDKGGLSQIHPQPVHQVKLRAAGVSPYCTA